jgi:hypothetical protein
VSTVRGRNEVVVGQLGANADRDGLLAGIEVNETGNETGREVLAGQVLERANLHHRLVHTEQGVPIQLHRSDRTRRHDRLQTVCRAAARRYHRIRCNLLVPVRI